MASDNMDQKPQHPVVFMRCTRGNTPQTKGMKCAGIRAYKMSPDGHPAPMYKCTSCKHIFSVGLGGAFNH